MKLNRLLAKINKLKLRIKEQSYELENQGYRIKNQRHEVNNRLKENAKLRELLKECLPIASAEIMTWQIRGGEEAHKRGQDLLTRVNAILGESEASDETC